MFVTIRSCFRLEKLFFGGKLDVSSVPKIPPKKSFQCENIIFLFLDLILRLKLGQVVLFLPTKNLF